MSPSTDIPVRGKVLIVVGPTASGKSELAMALAERFGGEIVNADSRQVYRGLDIGTAKPSAADRRRLPHHLYDVVAAGDAFSAASYGRQALSQIAAILSRGALPIVVGGSGLYIRALVDGFFAGPARSAATHDRLDAVAARGGLTRLYRWLARVDPIAAGRIGSGDRQRILRALDVYLQSGKTLSAHFADSPAAPFPHATLRLGIERSREELYERIERRADHMVSEGLLDEVRALAADPGFRGSNAEKALGYRSLAAHLRGEGSLGDALELLKRDTRRLAKRQATWFRRDRSIRWLRPGAHSFDESIVEVGAWLRSNGDGEAAL